jgi:beta-glucosidase
VAVAGIRGIQSTGVAACVKHFAANESETGRTEYTARLDQRTAREAYLAPFERSIHDGPAWVLMTAYNGMEVDGVAEQTVAHPWLLTEVLRDEWGFDGLVVSDWAAATRAEATAKGATDLVMPGPQTIWSGGRLAGLVSDGVIASAVVDQKVRHILRLASQVGAWAPGARLRTDEGAPAGEEARGRARAALVARELAARSTVVLANRRGRIPVRTVPRSVALIGPNAVRPFFQGGGSARVAMAGGVALVDDLRSLWPEAVFTAVEGAPSRRNPPRVPAADLRDLDGNPGAVSLDFLDAAGSPIRPRVSRRWAGEIWGIPTEVAAIRLRASIELSGPGRHWLGVSAVGRHAASIDGQAVSASESPAGEEVVLDSSANDPPAAGMVVEAGQSRRVTFDVTAQNVDAGGLGVFARIGLHHEIPSPAGPEAIRQAVEAAEAADLAIVVVGTNEEVESEGWDRSSLDLPGQQDALVQAVLAKRPEAIIVVNAGAPVKLPWLGLAQTVLWAWLPGEEFGGALADVLGGATEPAGRLPWTLPPANGTVIAPSVTPDALGVLPYTEGREIGYRAWLSRGLSPALPFGHGLGWTDWEYESASVTSSLVDDAVAVACSVRNVGERAGREVVQIYVEPPAGGNGRPVRWLGGFDGVEAGPGQAAQVVIHLRRRVFETWAGAAGWRLEPGNYRLLIGRSVGDIRLRLSVRL